jgi:amino acid transporter
LSIHTVFVGTNGIAGFGSALVACLWSYDGYCDMNFLMEELSNPVVELPRIVLFSLAIVTAAYVLANISYFAVLDAGSIVLSKSVAVDLGYKVGGTTVAALFAFGVVVSTLGSNNGSIMTGGRAFYAVARGGHAPAFLAKLNRAGAPYTALLAQGAWTLVLLLLPGSSFSTLLDYFGPASWFFYAVTSSALIVLRYKEPLTARPYKTPFYPLPPLLVIVIAGVVIVSSLVREPLYCGLAFGFIALSVPVHYAMERYAGFGVDNNSNGGGADEGGGGGGGAGGASALATQEEEDGVL